MEAIIPNTCLACDEGFANEECTCLESKESTLSILDNYPEVHHKGRIYQFLYSEQLNSWLCNFYYDPSNHRRRVVIEKANSFDHFYGN